jgi:hypothetical protein
MGKVRPHTGLLCWTNWLDWTYPYGILSCSRIGSYTTLKGIKAGGYDSFLIISDFASRYLWSLFEAGTPYRFNISRYLVRCIDAILSDCLILGSITLWSACWIQLNHTNIEFSSRQLLSVEVPDHHDSWLTSWFICHISLLGSHFHNPQQAINASRTVSSPKVQIFLEYLRRIFVDLFDISRWGRTTAIITL